MIKLEQVSKQYDNSQQTALTNINLTIQPGEIVGVVGESGSGKSTLLKLLNLTEEPDSGDVILFNQDIAQLTDKAQRGLKEDIGMIFQQYHLLHNLTVLDNVHLPLTLSRRKHQQKALSLLDMVGLKDKSHHYPNQLSGGQKQRVAIARALIRDPKLLLFDEATSALDEGTTDDILQIIRKIHETSEPTIVFVSHELETVQFLCERTLILDKGEIYADINHVPQINEGSHLSYPEKAKRRLSL